jgi:hypothetical protein
MPSSSADAGSLKSKARGPPAVLKIKTLAILRWQLNYILALHYRLACD